MIFTKVAAEVAQGGPRSCPGSLHYVSNFPLIGKNAYIISTRDYGLPPATVYSPNDRSMTGTSASSEGEESDTKRDVPI